MTVYFSIRSTDSIRVMCDYGMHQYVGCNRGLVEQNHEIINNDYYSCNADETQQFEPVCVYCPGNKHRKYLNRMRLDAQEEQE